MNVIHYRIRRPQEKRQLLRESRRRKGRLRATREALRESAGKRKEPWHGAMEATLFSG